jgi:choline dehydrogenase-like flavoprotein
MVYPDENQNRSSPFVEYAQNQVIIRDNLHILTGHRVTEIVWEKAVEGNHLVASGVHFQAAPDAPIHMARASREVLLAAGSLQSPQILELSGVGDPTILSAAGVKPQRILMGVGKNMQEQTKNTVLFQARTDVNFDGTGPPSAIAFPSARQLLGPHSDQWYVDVTAGLDEYAEDLASRNLVVNASATHTILQAQLDNLFNTTDAAAAELFFTINPQTNQVGIDNWNLIVMSRGSAHIRTNSSWNHPVIDPSYFDHPLDLAFQVAANRDSRRVFEASPLSDFVVKELAPGHTVVPVDASAAQWEYWVKKSFTSVWHYISTLSMMKRELGGVVDSRLKVYGIENVRVIDASVLPLQLSAHLSSSLYGVAEKAAGMIRKDNGHA